MATTKFDYKKAQELMIDPLKKKLVAVGFMLEKSAKQLCPVDTGRLRSSISTNWSNSGMARGEIEESKVTKTGKVKKGKQGAEEAEGVGQPDAPDGTFKVVVGTNVTYAPFIEFGTSKMGNTPFMRAAMEQYTGILTKLLADASVQRGS